jgi:hypothetical protein
MEEGPVRDVLVALGKGILVVASVPSWLLAAYFLAWFWPGVTRGQTCDLVHQPWCTPGRGMPQYVAVAVLLGSATVLLLTTLWTGLRVRRRKGRRPSSWVPACVCAVVAGAGVTVLPVLLQPHVPHWWFAA